MTKQLFKYKAFVLQAETLGFYRRTTPEGGCTHVSCGYKDTLGRYERYRAVNKVRCNRVWGKKEAKLREELAKLPDDYEHRWQRDRIKEDLEHFNAHCTYSLCKVQNPGKAPKVPELKKIKCKRVLYRRYTDKELSVPDTKPDAVAIRVHLSTNCRHGRHPNMVMLYDLLEDKWALNSWWTCSGGNPNTLGPRDRDNGGRCAPAPSEVAHIDEVVQKLKESL